MSHPVFVSVFSNGNVWFSNSPTGPTTSQEAGTLVTCVKVSSDASLQKIAAFTGSGNSSASSLAETVGKGTGASGSKQGQKELT